MKRHEIFFAAVRLPLEFALVVASFFLALFIRTSGAFERWFAIPPQSISSAELGWFALLAAFVFVAVAFSFDLYGVRADTSRIGEGARLVSASSYAFLLYVALVYLGNGYVYTVEIPRLVILVGFVFALGATLAERRIVNAVEDSLLARGTLDRRRIVLLLDRDEPAVVENVRSVGLYEIVATAGAGPAPRDDLPHIVGVGALLDLLRAGEADDLLLVHTDYGPDDLHTVFEASRIYGVGYRYVTNLFESEKSNTELGFIATTPVVEIRSIGTTAWSRLLKRLFDIVGSVVGIAVFVLPMFAIALAVKVWEPSAPVVFRNRRVGKNGVEFFLYKFRYIRWEYCVKDAYGVKPEDDPALAYERALIAERSKRAGAIYKIADDPRKTRVGAFIERYSLDELPQLFNVLFGTMSLVGPRPHQPREVALYTEAQRRVLTFKPGIT